MVELSLRKARTNWKQLSSPTKAKNRHSNDGHSQFKANPYKDLKQSANYSELPTIGSKERNKVGTSMQRRLSFHAPKQAPLDYTSVPLPQNLDIDHQSKQYLVVPNNSRQRSNSSIGMPRTTNKTKPIETQTDEVPLRQALSDPKFQAKDYVTSTLGNASALQIDNFTSELNDLVLEVTDEVKENITKSYSQVLRVNRDLSSASTELKHLRSSVKELQLVMGEFEGMADKRLQLERQPSLRTQRSEQPASLLPPVKANKRRDRTSVYMLERMWKSELSTLFKAVEGAQKFISPVPGRHILLETSDWYEVNAATLKPLKAVHVFLLNDLIMVATKNRDNRQHDLIACHCHLLRETVVDPQVENRILFTFGNRGQFLIQTNKTREYDRFVATVRGAKDDLNVISQAEEENTRKIRDSFTYMHATQQTPSRDLTLSPAKGHVRNSSLGNAQSGHINVSDEPFLLQTLSSSMTYPSQAGGGRNNSNAISQLEDQLENFDMVFARHNYQEAIILLVQLEKSMETLEDEISQENQAFTNLVRLKITHRKQLISGQLTQLISSEFTDSSTLTKYVENLVSLDYDHDALELFLQNRSKYIHDLILKVGSFQNPAFYLTQIAVIRFQTLKRVVISVNELFKRAKDSFSSTIVSWCSSEVDKHFDLISKQFQNAEMVPPSSIKSSRRQIDELKSVGLDFVYKLDDFIRENSERIG
ncbi:LADA_0D01750g1_1 [Lachancea dasiensis]|uniref:Exocyst complex component EXO84 n=1 Tax=Lachancea dasiensis TaxID=1072105 RepID=A0A1G4J4B7_9SACH|nr:LADA_0D01750g1_1 [Lachancea dasiensis]